MNKKTYKREVACAMLAFYFAAVMIGMWVPEAAEAAEKIKNPVFVFAGGAWGLDSMSKQVLR